jgi:putative transcriptional regulator
MRLRQWCIAFLVGFALVAVSARAADPNDTPVVLVAKPGLGEFYRGTVLFARPAGGGAHMGFIVNRPTRVRLAELFPGHDLLQKVSEPVFLGGPLHAESVFAVVHRAESPGDRAVKLAGDMFLIPDVETVDRVVEQDRGDARFYAGLVVWQPGELESEVQQGFWYVLDHDPDLVFRKRTEGMWEELVRQSSRML